MVPETFLSPFLEHVHQAHQGVFVGWRASFLFALDCSYQETISNAFKRFRDIEKGMGGKPLSFLLLDEHVLKSLFPTRERVAVFVPFR
jgi:hypothetical protein